MIAVYWNDPMIYERAGDIAFAEALYGWPDPPLNRTADIENARRRAGHPTRDASGLLDGRTWDQLPEARP